LITEVHPVVGLALQVSATDDEEVWAIMARRGGNEGGCSSDALHGLHDPELGELRFLLNAGPSQGSSVLSGTQFKYVRRSFQSGDTDYSVDFGPSGTLLRVPLHPYGTVVFGELHITRPPRPPELLSVFPDRGPDTGGTSVTITGSNFGPDATVTFGGTAATEVTFISSTSLTATTPAHVAGAVEVQVTVNGLSGSMPNGFTYVMD
jgi:hypothetical protein